MARTTSVVTLALGVLGACLAGPAFAQTAPGARSGAPAEVSAQSRPRPARARTRIRVTPGYPYRLYSTTYPVPYKYEYPGPGAVRQCSSWLVTENRVSGSVIVPKMRCWWERG